MEFSFQVAGIVGNQRISKWTRNSFGNLAGIRKKGLSTIIDMMGEASANAQNLRAPITSFDKLVGSDHILYLLVDTSRNNVLALIKIGFKKLFIRDRAGNYAEIEPLCVLDFYVHESCQRRGCGLELFTKMLEDQGISAVKLGYDRPSPKLLSFLSKHFSLRDFDPQANNYVVFRQYFDGTTQGFQPCPIGGSGRTDERQTGHSECTVRGPGGRATASTWSPYENAELLPPAPTHGRRSSGTVQQTGSSGMASVLHSMPGSDDQATGDPKFGRRSSRGSIDAISGPQKLDLLVENTNTAGQPVASSRKPGIRSLPDDGYFPDTRGHKEAQQPAAVRTGYGAAYQTSMGSIMGAYEGENMPPVVSSTRRHVSGRASGSVGMAAVMHGGPEDAAASASVGAAVECDGVMKASRKRAADPYGRNQLSGLSGLWGSNDSGESGSVPSQSRRHYAAAPPTFSFA
eukprot:Rmarinus@m.17893